MDFAQLPWSEWCETCIKSFTHPRCNNQNKKQKTPLELHSSEQQDLPYSFSKEPQFLQFPGWKHDLALKCVISNALLEPEEAQRVRTITHSYTRTNIEEWQYLPEGGVLPSLAVVVISAKLLSGSILHPNAQTHTYTHTLVCLRAGRALQRGRHVVTHTGERCCCWQTLPPHYCPCHLAHRRPAVAISVPAWPGHCGPTRTSPWLKVGSHLLFIYLV